VNPAFADTVLQQALRDVTGGEPLAQLDDSFEETARKQARHRRR
jgi:hypothetical protein